MTITSPTNSRLLEKRKAVPLLLSSFPAPPTHIPPSPLPTTLPHINPPPSLPPSSPLPPLPGPSPITEHDTLMFISAARARRSSKLSLNSSRRESTATIASIVSKSGSCCSLGVPSLDSSSRSLRSFPSNPSLPASSRHTEKSSKLEPLIREEDPSELTQLLDKFPAHSPLPDADLSDHEKVLELAILPPSIRRIRNPPLTTDKLSSSANVRSPPPPSDDKDQGTSSIKQSHIASSKSYLHRAYSKSKLNKALPPLPAEPPESFKRAESPDIQSILASTPRPRRKSSSSLHSSSQPRSSSRTLRRASTRTGLKPRKSDTRPPPAPLHLSAAASTSRKLGAHSWSAGDSSGGKEASELPYVPRQDNGDESFVSDEGSFVQGSGAMIEIADNDEIDRLERELEGAGSDSDSSIDLHTPLPHVMLRDGLLSPQSKLLPATSRAPSPLSKRPGSMLSVASTSVSVMTKSGVFKDQRDTQRRRTRHRDGRLLRGGLGLTTGLGWSDSEDEDAPSPLTRRLSSLVLARKQSEDSLPTPLSSRSANSPLAATEPSADPPAERPWPRSSLPPTSWTKRTEMRTSTSSNSTASSALGRTFRSSGHSEVSSALSRWRRSESTADAAPTFQHNLDPADAAQETCSSSSTSSRSLLLPITPVGSDDSIQVMIKDMPEAKSVLGIIRPRQVAISSTSTSSSLSYRTRTQSNSSASSLAVSIGSHAGNKTPVPSMTVRTSVPRPLRLSQAPSRPASQAKAFPQMVGTISSAAKSTGGARSRVSSSSTTKAGSATPSTSRLARLTTKSLPSQLAATRSPSPPPSMPTDRPKPRTGTGMQYRTGGTTSRPTMMRTPSSGILRTPVNRSSNRDIGVAT